MVRKNYFLTEVEVKWISKNAKKHELKEAEFVRRLFDFLIERKDVLNEIMYKRPANANKD